MARSRPGNSACSDARARDAAEARWLSMVTMTTRMGVLSAAEMRFGIVEGLDRDQVDVVVLRKALRVAARLGANEEGNLVQLTLRLGRPGDVGKARQFD